VDDLSISPEELNNIIGGDEQKDEPQSGGGDSPLSQDDINRLLAEQGGSDAPAPVTPGISPDELSKITGATPLSPGGAASSVQPMATPQPATAASGSTARPAQFAPLQPSQPAANGGGNLDMLLGVNLKVTVELGRTRMSIEEILQLGPGSVIELEKLAGEPVDVLINDRLIARGEVVVIDDRFGVRITDVVPPAQRVHSMH